MSAFDPSSAAGTSKLTCANCGQPLDPTDKFCRECGLPTVRQAQTQKHVPTLPPDTQELKRALDATPDPRPFLRTEPEAEEVAPPSEETTGSVVQVTSPTFATSMAVTTAVMVGVLILMAVVGIVLLILAFRV